MEDKEIVTITGVSGYIGSQVCLTFLKAGQFRVRGTVRSTSNQAKIEPLKKAFGEYFDQLELVEADLLDKESIMRACQGSTYIVHTASPFPVIQPKDENEVIRPAVEGTLAVMEAAQANKVKRVVITSSVAAIIAVKDKKKVVFTEDDWSELDSGLSAYEKSKTLAERAAWDFQAKLAADESFEVVTINPGIVLGPTLVTCFFSCGDIMKKFLLNEYPGAPKLQLPTVDVRDVAEAHLQGLILPEAANKRFILSARCIWFVDIGRELKEYYGAKYNPCTNELPYALCWIVQWFVPDLKMAMPLWGLEREFDNSRAREILKLEFIDPKQSIREMADNMMDLGLLPDKR